MNKRMCMAAFSLLLVVGLVGFVPAQDEDTVTIEWKFKKGQVLYYDLNQSVETEFGGMGFEQEMVFGMKQEVESVSEKGIAKIKVVYDRIKVSMSGMMESEYDSEKDEEAPEDPMGQIMAGFLGKSFKLHMAPDGEVVKVEGYDKIMEGILEDLDDETGMMGEMLKGQYNDENMKSMMQQGYVLLPKKAVAVGDTWKKDSSFKIPNMGAMTMKNKATLKKVKDDGKTAVIGVDTEISLGDKEEGEEDPMGGMVDITEANSESEVLWSLEKGQLTSMKTTMTMTMEAMGNEIEMKMKMHMKLRKEGAKKGGDVPSEDKKKKKGDEDY